MAEPNFAAVASDLSDYFDVFDELQKDFAGATTGLLDTIETARDTFTGDWEQGIAAFLQGEVRGRAAGMLAPETVGNAEGLGALLNQFAVAIGSGADKGDFDAIWEDLYDYCIDNTQSVNSRDFTWGSPSAGGSNVGNGTLIRCTDDEQGQDCEGWWPATYTVTCEQDGRGGDLTHEEVFSISGGGAAPDNIERTGIGTFDVELRALSARDSQSYVQNPSWNDFSGTAAVGSPAAPTALPGWTVTSGGYTNLVIDLDTTYRTTPGDNVSAALQFTDNETISQDLVSVQAAVLDTGEDVPWFIDVAVYRESNCDGTLTITCGGVSRAVTMSTLTNGAWNRVRLVATPGANNWFANFNANSLTLSFALASRTTGTLYLDDLVFAPFTRVGGDGDARTGRGSMGTYLALLGGTTPFKKGDLFTFTDSVGGTRGVIQYWLAEARRGYLPHDNGGLETIADS